MSTVATNPNQAVMIIRQNHKDGTIQGVHTSWEVLQALKNAGVKDVQVLVMADMGEEEYLRFSKTQLVSGMALANSETRLLRKVFGIETHLSGDALINHIGQIPMSEMYKRVRAHYEAQQKGPDEQPQEGMSKTEQALYPERGRAEEATPVEEHKPTTTEPDVPQAPPKPKLAILE